MFTSLFSFFLIAHFASCGWYLVIHFERDYVSEGYSGNNEIFFMQTGWKYARAFYWAISTMTSFNNTYPTTDLEAGFTLAVCVVGVVFWVILIGTVQSLFQQLDATETEFKNKIERLSNYLRYRKIPDKLQSQVLSYFQYLWSSSQGLDTDMLADSDLPEYIRVEIALHLSRDIIQKVPLFKNVDQQFINSMVLKLKPFVALPSVYIMRKGEIGKEMFFLSRGNVEVVSEDGSVVYASLKDGSFFGEMALLFNSKRSASVRSVGYCDLFVLTKQDFDQVMLQFPEQKKIVMTEAEKRNQMNQNKAAGKSSDDSSNSASSSSLQQKKMKTILKIPTLFSAARPPTSSSSTRVARPPSSLSRKGSPEPPSATASSNSNNNNNSSNSPFSSSSTNSASFVRKRSNSIQLDRPPSRSISKKQSGKNISNNNE